MTKMLIAVLALSALGYLAYRTMYVNTAVSTDPEVPAQRLENVQNKANDLGAKDQQRADEVEKNTKNE